MSIRRDKIKQSLDRATTGMSTRHIAEALSEDSSPESLGAIEFLCLMSPDFQTVNGAWLTTRVGKAAAVLVALENYVTSTGKRIFRSSAALEGLPADTLPTEEELVQILESCGQRFELLPNQMIKFNK
jgi:hypothetical protein